MRVVIVGAGVVGASIAFELASRGADVTVLDMRSAGRGASQASAGILAPFSEADRDSALLDLGRRSLDLWDDFIARVRDASGRAVEYARTGTLHVALDDAERVHLLKTKTWLDAEQRPATWLEAEELRTFEPSVTHKAAGALHIHRHGFVNARALVIALVQAARFAGAVFEDGVEVVAVDPAPDTVSVRTQDGRTYGADHVVVAAGSWSRELRIRGAAPVPVRPVRGQLLQLRMPLQAGSLPGRIVWGTGCYAVPWSDGTLLAGGTVEDVGFDESSTVAGVAGLTQAISELLPASAGASIEAVRVGLRPASDTGLPMIGPMSGVPRVSLATGHYRNGILLAPLTAAIVTEQVFGRA
jgi:glycine oxidase